MMSDTALDTMGWIAFRMFLVELEDAEFEQVYEQLEKEAIARRECDTNATRLLFSSMTPGDLNSARQYMVAERHVRIEDRYRCAPEKRTRGTMPAAGVAVFSQNELFRAECQNSLACEEQRSDESDNRGNTCGPKEKPNMATFTITDDNNITAFTSSAEAAQAATAAEVTFDSQAALARLTASWPLGRFVDIFNGIPGNIPIARFADRTKAVARIWRAIQPLAGDLESGTAAPCRGNRNKSSQPARSSKEIVSRKAKKRSQAHAVADSGSKKALVIAMMKRAKGATLPQIMLATGWQAHTVRGLVSVLANKGGENIESSKNASHERTYRIPK
jgi:hypothetical protein